MWQWSYIDNLHNLDTSTVDSTDSRLTTVTGTLNISLNLAKAQVVSNLSTILSSHLSSIRSILLRATEAHLTS